MTPWASVSSLVHCRHGEDLPVLTLFHTLTGYFRKPKLFLITASEKLSKNFEVSLSIRKKIKLGEAILSSGTKKKMNHGFRQSLSTLSPV